MKNFWLKLQGINSNSDDIIKQEPNFSSIGSLLKEKRELRGLSLSELAIKTRISVAVIDAIENGWRNQLPEKTYLTKILATLEQELKLDKDTLKVFLPNNQENEELTKMRIFTPASINLFSNWQGTVVYFIAIIVCILLINRHQRYLSRETGKTTDPHLPKELIDKIYDIHSV